MATEHVTRSELQRVVKGFTAAAEKHTRLLTALDKRVELIVLDIQGNGAIGMKEQLRQLHAWKATRPAVCGLPDYVRQVKEEKRAEGVVRVGSKDYRLRVLSVVIAALGVGFGVAAFIWK